MLRTLLSAAAAVPAFFSPAASAREVDLGVPVAETPYDRYFAPLREVFDCLDHAQPKLVTVNDWMEEARAFRYEFDEPYVPQVPAVTERLRAGDCKAKSLWLAAKMDDGEVRFVVGKFSSSSPISHAWLLWLNQGRWYVLDPTMKTAARDLAMVSDQQWIPQYSYSAKGKFRHAAADEVAAVPWLRPIGGFAANKMHFTRSQLWLLPSISGRQP